MTTAEQKQRILKAKVAVAMRDEFGHVPKAWFKVSLNQCDN
jgi:hypothetical protein